MKKKTKIILIIIGILLLLITADILSIFLRNEPIFAIKKDNVYKGILYDTYLCSEYTVPQIKSKFTKFSCDEINFTNKEVKSIIDTSIGKDLSFAMALEQIYEDEQYTYYLGCIKSSVIIVTYTNGEEENIKDALANGNITIKDLEEHNISFIKESKENM